MEIAQLGYERQGTAAELVDKAETIVFDVAQGRTQDGLTPIKGLLVEEFARIEKLAESGQRRHRRAERPEGPRPDPVRASSRRTSSSSRPARAWARRRSRWASRAHVGSRRTCRSPFFSLEMSRLELTQRLMCAEARVDSQNLRTGRLREDDWGRLVGAVGRLSRGADLHRRQRRINVMEIRAKARRLKSQSSRASALIVVDYLQLMQRRDGVREPRRRSLGDLAAR